MWLSILALIVACEGHVRLIHKPYFTRPIRNAATVSSDGTLSTSGPCGGVLTWGNKTFSTVTPGENVSLVFAYNGGHQDPMLNMIRVAMVCGRQGSDALLKNSTVAPTFSPLVNASASLTTGYDLWVIIPQIQNITNGQYCTISALDKRNWGGCIDVEIVNAAAPTNAPANALAGVSLAGSYSFGNAECVGESPNCCCAVGQLNVSHTTGAASATGSLLINSCNGTNVTDITGLVSLTQTAINLGSVRGSVTLNNGKILTFQVTASGVISSDDSAAPMFCGVNTKASTPTPSSPSTDSASAHGVLVGFVVTLAAALFF